MPELACGVWKQTGEGVVRGVGRHGQSTPGAKVVWSALFHYTLLFVDWKSRSGLFLHLEVERPKWGEYFPRFLKPNIELVYFLAA